MLSLRNILRVNAISSGITGLGLAAFPAFIASLFEVNASSPFLAVGLFLLVFAGLVMLAALQATINTKLVRIIIGLDTSWVIGSIVTILLLYNSISLLGVFLIIGVAVWVAIMALLQNNGLKISNIVTNPV